MVKLTNKNHIQELSHIEVVKVPDYSLTVPSDKVSERKLEPPTGELFYFDL